MVEKGGLLREHSTEDRRKVVVRASPEADKKALAIETSVLQLFVALVEKIGVENTQKGCDALAGAKAALAGDSVDPFVEE